MELPDDGQASVVAEIEIPLGTVEVGQAEDGSLFQAEVTLPVNDLALAFETESDGAEARLSLGMEGTSASLQDLRQTPDIAWSLLFSHETPLDLTLTVGAAEADLNLTGVPLRRLDLTSGVARTRLSFEAPNTETLVDFDIEAGVSEFAAVGLGHARFERLTFDGGVGRFSLDFSGDALVPGAEAEITIGVASLELVLPRSAHIVLDLPTSRVTAVRLPEGLTTLGNGRYATSGAEDNPDALTIRVEAGPGRVNVRWADG